MMTFITTHLAIVMIASIILAYALGDAAGRFYIRKRVASRLRAIGHSPSAIQHIIS